MKTLLLSGSLLALLALVGCTKTEEAAPAVAPPAGVSQSGGPAAAQGGGPQMQSRSTGAVSNQ